MGSFARRGASGGTAVYQLNSTEEYHKGKLGSLGWELTVCNTLHPSDTPVRKFLVRSDSYGYLLHDHLKRFFPLEKIEKVIEIGGGYGYLMKDLLDRCGHFKACMLDISPVLLEKQKETLKGHDVSYRLEDAMKTDQAMLGQYGLAILNENLGDFPALIDLDIRILERASYNVKDPIAKKVAGYFETYGLERPAIELFNLNIGAMEMTEKLCLAGIPYIFIGEHSCEAKAPRALGPYINLLSDGNPRRITLKGHDEYTIKFSYLQKIAGYHGYETVRGPFADYLVPNLTEHLKAILASRGLYSDNEEAVCHFISDLYEYEYLVLKKGPGKNKEHGPGSGAQGKDVESRS